MVSRVTRLIAVGRAQAGMWALAGVTGVVGNTVHSQRAPVADAIARNGAAATAAAVLSIVQKAAVHKFLTCGLGSYSSTMGRAVVV